MGKPESTKGQEGLFPEEKELVGVLERTLYHNEETSYTVASFRAEGHSTPVTVVGSLLGVNLGERLRLRGRWETHPRFGPQYRVESYSLLIPATASDIEKYLASGVLKGIGPVMASRLVKCFGEKTLEVLDREPERLSEVPGIGPKRFQAISEAWREQQELRDVMLFLQSHDVSASHAAKIYRHYGGRALAIVREDPYRLASDIFGIGFKTADGIAQRLGFPPNSRQRAEAGIIYTLQELTEEGHLYFPRKELIERCGELLGMEHPLIESALLSLKEGGRIIEEELPEDLGGRAIYLPAFHLAEKETARRLKALISTPRPDTTSRAFPKEEGLSAKEALRRFAREATSLGPATSDQRRAIEGAITEKVLVITGGPGTGKTTVISAVASLLSRLKLRVALAAPTGRAAKRLSELTGKEAMTVHRLLEYSPHKARFERDAENPLRADAVIIDEASMLDAPLTHHLLKAIPPEASLVLVGDVDQLPSVGPGNVLKDLIRSRALPVVWLREIFRQARESLIVINAHRVNAGQFPALRAEGEELSDFYFIEEEDPRDALRVLLEVSTRRIPERFGFDPLNDIQVLTPMNKGVVGAANLNSELQRALNPSGQELPREGRAFRVRDKVMQIRNNYEKGVFNGDIGQVRRIDLESGELEVDFGHLRVGYDRRELDELVHAYAVTVHKSQGSEYPAVVLPLLTQHFMLLQRNLLYTALTRARKLAVIIGSKKAMAIAVKNDKVERRFTALAHRLRDAPSPKPHSS